MLHRGLYCSAAATTTPAITRTHNTTSNTVNNTQHSTQHTPSLGELRTKYKKKHFFWRLSYPVLCGITPFSWEANLKHGPPNPWATNRCHFRKKWKKHASFEKQVSGQNLCIDWTLAMGRWGPSLAWIINGTVLPQLGSGPVHTRHFWRKFNVFLIL